MRLKNISIERIVRYTGNMIRSSGEQQEKQFFFFFFLIAFCISRGFVGYFILNLHLSFETSRIRDFFLEYNRFIFVIIQFRNGLIGFVQDKINMMYVNQNTGDQNVDEDLIQMFGMVESI